MQFSNKRLQISDIKDYTTEQNFNLSPILCQNDSFSAPNFVFLKKKFLKKRKFSGERQLPSLALCYNESDTNPSNSSSSSSIDSKHAYAV